MGFDPFSQGIISGINASVSQKFRAYHAYVAHMGEGICIANSHDWSGPRCFPFFNHGPRAVPFSTIQDDYRNAMTLAVLYLRQSEVH